MTSRIVALIPARGGSKRVPRKNIKPLAGHPLLAYTIAAAKQSGIFGDVIVSTEDPEIEYAALSYNATTLRRPAEFARDLSPDIEWLTYALQNGGLARDYDAFAILRPTSPFRSAATIQRAWKAFTVAGDSVDSLRAVEPVSQHPGKMWDLYTMPSGLELIDPLLSDEFWGIKEPPPAHSRATQSLPKVYAQNASLEIAHVRTVTEKHSISGNRVLPFFTEGFEGLDVNTELDWLFAEWLVEKGLAKLPEVS